jgi:hypothetical protein
MKILNLVFAIIYTVILWIMIIKAVAVDNYDVFIGTLILAGPTVVNWITFRWLSK